MTARKHWTDPDWTPSPETAALSDDELLDAACAQIKLLAQDIAHVVDDVTPGAVEHGLFGHRWPAESLDPGQLCDVIDEAVLILEHVREGLSLDSAVASVAVLRGLRTREREHYEEREQLHPLVTRGRPRKTTRSR